MTHGPTCPCAYCAARARGRSDVLGTAAAVLLLALTAAVVAIVAMWGMR